jgi:hypothetical protein
MKRRAAIVFAALLVLAVVAPAWAQIQITIPGFRSDFPWFTNVPQAQTFEQFLANHPDEARELSQNPGLLYDPSWRAQHRQLQYFLQTHPDVWEGLKAQGADIYDTRFSQFLANHPEVAADLRDDPELLYDPEYRNNHPALAQFLAAHPRVWANLNAQHEAAGPAPGQLGAYDNQHRWHDADWWHQNNPDWFWAQHPEWASVNPQWRDEDGAYDQRHQWHYGQWWSQQNPDWVASRHPDWLREHPNWRSQQPSQLGAYDNRHRWHDADWWHQNNPDWFWAHHPG